MINCRIIKVNILTPNRGCNQPLQQVKETVCSLLSPQLQGGRSIEACLSRLDSVFGDTKWVALSSNGCKVIAVEVATIVLDRSGPPVGARCMFDWREEAESQEGSDKLLPVLT